MPRGSNHGGSTTAATRRAPSRPTAQRLFGPPPRADRPEGHLLRTNRRLARHLDAATARIAELESANQRLELLSLTDDVTGLHNQRALFARLADEMGRLRRYGGELATMMIDVDHFKAVNDGHDHLFGSRVLRRLGQVLLAGLRDSDFVARYGGDEFAVVLPQTELTAASLAAARLRQQVETSNLGDARQALFVTISAGVATVCTSAVRTPEQLLLAADQAMYAAKAAGRNRVAAAGSLAASARGRARSA